MKKKEILKLILINCSFYTLFISMLVFRVRSSMLWLAFFGLWLYLNSLLRSNIEFELVHWIGILLGITATSIIILSIT